MIHPVILKPNIGGNGLLNGLVSMWEFENNALDSHGSNDGTVSGATYTSSGKIGGCYDFDGSNDIITIPKSTELTFDGFTDSYSVSLWFNSSDTNNSGRLIEDRPYGSGQGSEFSIRINYNSDNVSIALYDGSNIVYISISGTFGDGNWHHVVMVVDQISGNAYIYVDNSSNSGSLSSLVESTQSLEDIFIHGKSGGSAEEYLAKIDEVMIYNRALSATEVAALYNNGNGLSYSQLTA